MNIGSILAGSDGVTELTLPEYHAPQAHSYWSMVDCEKANELLTFNTFDKQRNLREQKRDHYAQQMKDGDWQPGADGGIQLARTGSGVWELMNGQHRLHAVIASGVSVPFLITEYTFTSERDKYAFFASVDQGAKRTESDALLALGVQSTLVGVDKKTIRTATSSVKAIEMNFRPKGGNMHNANPHTNTTGGVKRVLDAFSDPIRATASALLGNKVLSRTVLNSSAFGIALLTFTYAPEEAQEFWPEVIDPNVLTKGTSQYALNQYLFTHTPSSEGIDTYPFCVANAWNAFAEGRGIELLKKGSNQTNIRVACTPMDGKNVNAGREIIAARLASHGGQK